MITKISSIEELKGIFIEILLNKTSKITKVTDGSVLNGISYGVAKIGQKALKDIALVEANLFPDSAYGTHLDNIANNIGIAGRFSEVGSSTYIRIVANIGTQYLKNVHTFSSNTGVNFELEEDFIMGNLGYAYVKVNSQSVGLKTNVDPLAITKVSPIPIGHTYSINEYKAEGGRDIEDDISFRKRIKESLNIYSSGTLAFLTQILLKINNNILKILYYGKDANGKLNFGVLSQNGRDFTTVEFDQMLERMNNYLNLNDLNVYGYISQNIILKNIDWHPIDISFRADIDLNYNSDEIRKEIQIKLNKYIDYRLWDSQTTIQWDDLLQIVKSTQGIKYVPDQYFYPNFDIFISLDKLPRFRGFLMLNLQGNIVQNIAGTLNPIYYPQEADFIFQQNILKNL